MRAGKKILCLLLVSALLCGMLMSGSAETTRTGIDPVTPGDLSGGKAEIAGHKSTVSISEVQNGKTVEVMFTIYLDYNSYFALGDCTFYVEWDSAYLNRVTPIPAVFINGAPASTYLASGSTHYYQVLFNDYPDPNTFHIAPNGYAIDLIYTFSIADAALFNQMDPLEGTKVTLRAKFDDSNPGYPYTDFAAFERGSTALTGTLLDGAKIKAIPAVVTYSAPYLEYNIGAGTRANDMDAFGRVPIKAGANFTPANGAGLKIDKAISPTNYDQFFSHWSYGSGSKYYPSDIGGITMPEGGLTLTAVYVDDKDEDGIPDDYEYVITYTLRAGDEGTITFPASTTQGKFYDITPTSGKINVLKNAPIGTGVPTSVNVSGIWKFVGYFIDNTKYATEAALSLAVASADTAVEVRTMPDANDNNIDDRENVTLNFFANGANPATDLPVKTYQVLDGTPYTTFTKGDKTAPYALGTGNANALVNNVVLPLILNTTPEGKFEDWIFEAPVVAGKITSVTAYPSFQANQDVGLEDIVPEPSPGNPDPNPENIVEEMPIGALVIHRDINGNEIKRTEVDSDRAIAGIQHITNPVPGSVATLPVRNATGNAFKGWKLTGPLTVTGTTVYYLDPIYKNPVRLIVTDQKTKATTADDVDIVNKDVPADSTYEIRNENGGPGTKTPVPGDGSKVRLPAIEDMPPRNADGQIYTGEWIPTEEPNPNGSTNYVFTPKYKEPTGDDVEILNGVGAGDGVFVMSGRYANDTQATMEFYVNIGDAPALASDTTRLKAVAKPVYGFETIFQPQSILGTQGPITYAGTKTIGSTVYGVFRVTNTAIRSGIVKINLTYGNIPVAATAPGYIIVTVADVTIDGLVNASDAGNLQRVVNGINPMPGKGAANSYRYELSDANENNIINASDVGVVSRMINGIYPSN